MKTNLRIIGSFYLMVVSLFFVVGCSRAEPQEFTLTFHPTGGILNQTTLLVQEYSSIVLPVPTKHGCVFIGWFIENDQEQQLTEHITIQSDLNLYAKWANIPSEFEMVSVGTQAELYIVPINTQDTQTAEVQGGFKLAVRETTYELWYDVLQWALVHGYHFQNLGREGSVGVIGAQPTEAKLEPVLSINWRDAIVWLNALSEKNGMVPVYQTTTDEIIKDSRNENAAIVDAAVQKETNGYRLPTVGEWQMAARWISQVDPVSGATNTGGRYWLPGNFASGATASITNLEATDVVAWYRDDSTAGYFDRSYPVATKSSNELGIYDMSGNAAEWCFDGRTVNNILKRELLGGAWYSWVSAIQVGLTSSRNPFDVDNGFGLRIAQTP